MKFVMFAVLALLGLGTLGVALVPNRVTALTLPPQLSEAMLADRA